MAPRVLEPLRPKPFRGDVIAAGVVVLVTLVFTLEARFQAAWGDGVHLAYAAGSWALVVAMAVLAPMERETPRAYQSVLYVASFALALAALADLADVLGSSGQLRAAGADVWIFGALAAQMLGFATRRNSAASTLLGAVSAGVAVVAAVQWLFAPHGYATQRWVLLVLVVVYGFTAVGLRDRRFRHGVALVDAGGLALLAIAATFGLSLLGLGFDRHAGWGWELVILAGGWGLIAYSSVDREAGPAYLGVANLAAFTAITSLGISKGGATLMGWPLFLLVVAVALLAVGLRPTSPAPPPPDADEPPAPTVPLR